MKMSVASILVAIIKVSCKQTNLLTLLLSICSSQILPSDQFDAPNIPFLPTSKKQTFFIFINIYFLLNFQNMCKTGAISL
jgi:hypothetical protein